ncbi:chlorophyllase-1-like [Lolium rigidum]|uniref:chlorophyllase-1-like n=1 Tax=Lolium rigidum TaxID=89674 RepID=UPI001F5DD559|nr:chlorophyllase-1-like [Lolium rigidum]
MELATGPVFYRGLLPVDVKNVKPNSKGMHSLPKPVMVVAPTEEGTYPVIVFLHGCNLANHYYEQLLRHVASHGFIAVAPQLYWMTFIEDDSRDVNAAKQVTNWLAAQDGLQFVLENKFKLNSVKPDLSKLALAGHSRGGHAAFALALGLGNPMIKLALKFSALIGVDPVAGKATGCQVPPEILTFKPRSLDVGMPALVLGTGKGPEHVGGPPCAPAGVNHAAFYDECKPPRYHFVAEEYGHTDMLDDDAPYIVDKCMCKRNENGTKNLARQSMGGVMVAFLRAILEKNNEDLKAILDNPGLSPAILNPVEHDLA